MDDVTRGCGFGAMWGAVELMAQFWKIGPVCSEKNLQTHRGAIRPTKERPLFRRGEESM